MGIDMLECLRGGVTDIRLTGAPSLGLENDPAAGPSTTGVFSAIGPFQVDRFAAALQAVAVAKIELPEPVPSEIPSKYVLAQPWRFDRMLEAVEQTRADDHEEPVRCNRLRLDGLPDMFALVDGSHQAFAARETGKALLAAEIHAEYRCDVSGFCIEGDLLLRELDGERWPVSPLEPWGLPVGLDEAVVLPDISYVLQAIGIRTCGASERPIDMCLAKAIAHRLGHRGVS